jgi:transcriptional regulator with XRE-family HTH domain
MRSAPKSTTPVDTRVGARIRMRRMLVGISQTELGEKSGVTFQQIQKYEKGTNRVSVSRLHQIAQTLGVPVEFFYEGLSDGVGATIDNVPDVSALLGSADALDMLKAFAALENRAVRRRLVALTEQLVAAQSGADLDVEDEDDAEPAPASARGSSRKAGRSN